MKSGHLFDAGKSDHAHAPAPLADRMRPRTFDEFVGQQELLAPGRPLREAIDRDTLQSIILWGPPGTGKTTVARLIATTTHANFIAFSAVLAGIKEIKAVMAQAQDERRQANAARLTDHMTRDNGEYVGAQLWHKRVGANGSPRLPSFI